MVYYFIFILFRQY